MNILILQYWYDKYGGIESVNEILAEEFSKKNNVTKLSLYKDKGSKLQSKIYNNKYVFEEAVRPSMKRCLMKIKKLKFSSAFIDIKLYIKYLVQKFLCKSRVKKELKEIEPDKIIVSSIELIKYIPNRYLSNTFLHMHSSVDYFFKEKNYFSILKKYCKKINKVIWLTEKFSNQALDLGIVNSEFVYNPLKFKSNKTSNLNQKQIIYVGRIAKEKRVDLLITIFNKFNKKNPDWKLKIVGEVPEDFSYEKNDNIEFVGKVSDVKMELLNSSIIALTSLYEGFPMALLEAYECGVPAIVFDFGLSTFEILDSGNNGFIIEKDNIDMYVQKLELYAKDESLRSKFGKSVKKYSSKFYPKKIVKKWYKLFGVENEID